MDFRYQWKRMLADISQHRAPAVTIPSTGETACKVADYQVSLDCLKNPNQNALCITGAPGVGKSTQARKLVEQSTEPSHATIPIYDSGIADLTGITRVRVDDDAVHAFDTDGQNLQEMFIDFYQGLWLRKEGIMVTGLERIAISQLSLLRGAEFQTEILHAFAKEHKLPNWQSDAAESAHFWQRWFEGRLLEGYGYMDLLTAEQHDKWKQRLLKHLIGPIQDHELHPIPLNIVITAPPGKVAPSIADSFPERFDRARFVEVLPAMCAFYVYLTEMFPDHYFRVEAFDEGGKRKTEDIMHDEIASILYANQWTGICSLSP